MLDMIKQEIIPAVFAYQFDLIQLVEKKKAYGYSVSPENTILMRISELADSLFNRVEALDNSLKENDKNGENSLQLASFYRFTVFSLMSELREITDELEQLVAKKHWPYPLYSNMLFSVR
jgi:glutamine synthetase